MDAKDILGLPKTPLSVPHEKKSRQKESQRKPDGIHREVYALTGGVPPPLMPSIELSQFKRRPQSEEKITWQWLPFSNSARKDDLKLYHWVRIVNGVAPTGDYSFAKYNKSVDVIKYTDEEYENYLINPMWTKEETCQLFELCERFDLRFVVIADRFSPPRPVEELKNRYYSVVRAILLARATSPADVADHPLVKEPYDVSREIERKRALSMVLSHSKHQERKDSEILAEAKRIAQARAAARAAENPEPPIQFSKGPDNTEKASDPSEAISPSDQLLSSSVVPTPPVIDTSATLASLRMLKVYLRSYALDQMVQAASASAGLRTIKRVEQTLQDLGINLKPRVPSKAVCDEHLELRNEILTLLNLQKQLQHKDAEGVAYHDGSLADASGSHMLANSAGDADRSFMAEPLIFRAEPVVKKDHKRKGPGRANESPSSPAQSIKRPRKLKAND